MMDAKKKRKKMPSAPIKAPVSNVGGRLGLFTGGEVPSVVAPVSGNSNPMQYFMRGYDGPGKPTGRKRK